MHSYPCTSDLTSRKDPGADAWACHKGSRTTQASSAGGTGKQQASPHLRELTLSNDEAYFVSVGCGSGLLRGFHYRWDTATAEHLSIKHVAHRHRQHHAAHICAQSCTARCMLVIHSSGQTLKSGFHVATEDSSCCQYGC